MVEVTAPDGTVELWAAAVPHDSAVAAVKAAVPADYMVRASSRRMSGARLEGLRHGEVRRVSP